MFSISLKNTRSLTRNFLYLRPRRCIATGNKAVVGEWNGRWANKEREREREGESGPGSDGILISSRYRPASPRSFRLVVVFEGRRIEEPAPVASLTEKFQRFSRSLEWFFEVAFYSFFLSLLLLLSSFDHLCPLWGSLYVYARKSFRARRLLFARGAGRGETPLGNLTDKAR